MHYSGKDEFDFQFRPITPGLGFKIGKASQKEMFRNTEQTPLNKQYGGPNTNSDERGFDPIVRGELAPFYNDRIAVPVPQITDIPKEQKDDIAEVSAPCFFDSKGMGKRASLRVCTIGHFLDIAIIAAAVALTFIVISFAINMTWKELLNLEGLWPYALLISLIYSLFYFIFVGSTKSSLLRNSHENS